MPGLAIREKRTQSNVLSMTLIYAVLLLLMLVPAYEIQFSLFGLFPLTLFEVSVALIAGAGLVNTHIRRAWRNVLHNLPFVFKLSIIFFVSAAVVSVLVSESPRVSLGIFKGWIATPLAYAFLFLAEVRSRVDRMLAVVMLGTVGAVVALYGIAQAGTVDRVYGIFDVPNSLALFLAPLVVLSYRTSVPEAQLSKGFRRYLVLLSIIMGFCLLLTQSIAGIFSVFGVLIIGTARFASRLRLLVLCGLVLASASFLTLSGRLSYFVGPFINHEITSSLTVRQQLWSVGWQLVLQHPLQGIGLGMFEPHYQRALHERFASSHPNTIPEFVFRDPHNWILSFWLNTGLLGLAAFIGIHGIAFRGHDRNWPDLSNEDMRPAAILALLTLAVFGLTDTIYWKNDLAVIHWLLIALLL